MNNYRPIRAIVSGGGTGGHIFPAVSIASKIKELSPDSEILFVGAEGKMEMEKVPAAGFRIIGLPIYGLQRQLDFKNLTRNIKLPFNFLRSIGMAKKIIREFNPDVAIGVGGYASAPLLFAATSLHVPTLIQEQNGFAGLTNRMLAKKVDKICVAYEGMEKFFPADKIVLTGNPLRGNIHPYTDETAKEGVAFYGLSPEKKHILVIGGSLGCRTLNETMKLWIESGMQGGEGVDVLWQCGKYYKNEIDRFMEGKNLPAIHYSDFISRMDLAYAAADLVISRSGASSVSEICAIGKPAVFVPSPNVAEDHQTHNAMALVKNDAAAIVRDDEARTMLTEVALKLLSDTDKLKRTASNALRMAKPDAAETIVNEIYGIL